MTNEHDTTIGALAEGNPALAEALERKRLADQLRALDREDLAIAVESPKPGPEPATEVDAIRTAVAELGSDWVSIPA